MRGVVASAAVALLAGVLTGCTVNLGAPVERAPEPAPVETQAVSALETPSPEDAFLDFMQREAPMTYSEVAEHELIAGGYTVCTFFRDGGSGGEVAAAMAASAQATGGSVTDALALVYGAVDNFCPEYSAEMQNLG